ncbi:MAG: TlpA family protein disulfide reductase [Gammaproteobacteria bacterium]|nr:TlpA family protein disulfide reductase [Gammaproteobacteria bacterium]
MRQRLQRALLPACLAAGIGLTGCQQASPPDALQLDRPFPALVVHDLDGGALPLDSYRGRVVILNVWATWCGPCRKELPGLDRLSARLDPQRFAVIGLSVDDDRLAAREYLDDIGVGFVNYIDQGRRLARDRLGIRVYPDTFVISHHGMLVQRFSGARDWDAPELIAALEHASQGDYTALRGM